MTAAPLYEMTLPQLLARRARERGETLALREKDRGLWRRKT
jgi:long-chain acyl-CoA synthetase